MALGPRSPQMLFIVILLSIASDLDQFILMVSEGTLGRRFLSGFQTPED